MNQTNLVLSCGQQVEESNDSSLKFCATAGVDGGRGERFPHNGLADVGRNEERDTRA